MQTDDPLIVQFEFFLPSDTASERRRTALRVRDAEGRLSARVRRLSEAMKSRYRLCASMGPRPARPGTGKRPVLRFAQEQVHRAIMDSKEVALETIPYRPFSLVRCDNVREVLERVDTAESVWLMLYPPGDLFSGTHQTPLASYVR